MCTPTRPVPRYPPFQFPHPHLHHEAGTANAPSSGPVFMQVSASTASTVSISERPSAHDHLAPPHALATHNGSWRNAQGHGSHWSFGIRAPLARANLVRDCVGLRLANPLALINVLAVRAVVIGSIHRSLHRSGDGRRLA
jgi:hypothetical protein